MSHLRWFVLSVVAALLVACADTPDREPSGQGGNGGSGGIAGAGGEGGAGGSGGDGGGGSAGIGGSGGTGEGGAGGEGGTGGDGGDEFEAIELAFEDFCVGLCNELRRGDTRKMYARAIDRQGNAIEPVEVEWSSSDETVVTVDSTGLVRAVGVGEAEIRATLGPHFASMPFFVFPQRVFRVELVFAQLELELGDSATLEVVAYGEQDEVIPDAEVELVSMNHAVLAIEPEQTVRAIGPGAAWVAGRSPDGIPGHERPALVEVTSTQTLPAGAPFVQISGDGDLNRCGLFADGSAYCWGRNDQGQLGRGFITSPEFAFPVPGSVAGGHVFQSISAHCGLDTGGQLWCWGNNTDGSLGLGKDVPGTPEPLPVRGGHVFVQFAGSCAIDDSAQAWCWGSNANGQVGTGVAYLDDPKQENWIIWEPTAVVGEHRFVELATTITGWANCGRDEEGAVWCWGSNDLGELGIGSGTTHSATPVRVAAEVSFVKLVGGTNAFCALTAAGETWCWGNNHAGSLDPSRLDEAVLWLPVPVATDHRFVDIAMGFFSACGLDDEGQAWCWGLNEFGQTGTGLFTNVGHEPRLVHGAHRFRALFPHCGITVGGEALCWGPNDFGVTGGNFLGELTAVPWPVAQPDDDAEPVPWLP